MGSSRHVVTILNVEGSLIIEEDAPVDVVGGSNYLRAFLIDGVPLSATDRVRPWTEGRGAA